MSSWNGTLIADTPSGCGNMSIISIEVDMNYTHINRGTGWRYVILNNERLIADHEVANIRFNVVGDFIHELIKLDNNKTNILRTLR